MEVSTQQYVENVLPFEQDRWAFWAISFPYPMKNRESARKNLAAVLPELRVRWEDWKRWLAQGQCEIARLQHGMM